MDGVYGDPYESGELQLTHDQIIRDESFRETMHALGGYLMIAIGILVIAATVAVALHSLPGSFYTLYLATTLGRFDVLPIGLLATFVGLTVILAALSKALFMVERGAKELTPGPNARDLQNK